MKLLIIRHGEPDYSIDSLTEKGWFEAELLSRRLIKYTINDFYCSPLGRAMDTAKPTMQKLKCKPKILPWLEEFSAHISSPFTGKNRIPWDLPPTLWANEQDYYDNCKWKETELMKSGNVKEIYDRTVSGVDELLNRYGVMREGMLYRYNNHEDVTIALFCHFGLGMTIISYLTGISPVILWHNFFMPPSSVSTLITETDQENNSHFRCVQIGDTSHLYTANEEISLSGLYPHFEK